MVDSKQRRKSRKICLQVLYSNDVVGVNIHDVLCGKVILPHITNIDDYANKLITGTIENINDIDKRLSAVSENWTIDRMPSTDRCLLRQTVFEMLFIDEVPISVSINEAVELAKEFGGDDESHKFVNGVLGKIAKELENE